MAEVQADHKLEPAYEHSAYIRAKEREEIACVAEQRLANELWANTGATVGSAMAKLHAIIVKGEPEPVSGEFPWPQIRSIMKDLLVASAFKTSDPSAACEAVRRSSRLPR